MSRPPGRKGSPRRQRADRPYLVPGVRAVLELLAARPQAVRRILAEEGRSLPEVEAAASEAGHPLVRVERSELDDLVGPGLARGVVAEAAPPRDWQLDDLLARGESPAPARRLLLALDEVVDPANLGAILRSAEFFGAQGVIWGRDRSAPLSPLAVRASAGASERVPLCRVTNLAQTLRAAKDAGYWVVGTVVDAEQSLRDLAKDPPDRVLVVLGGEGRGLRRLTRQRCDFLVTIPRAGELGSLNVSAAAAVVLATLA